MIQKKVTMLGAYGVGKTCLVQQFVTSLFDEKYLATIGVKVDEKVVHLPDQNIKLLLWDVAGAEKHFSVPMSYIRGSSGCLLVIDGTRPDTFDRGLQLWETVQNELGDLPFVVALNKVDLLTDWRVDDTMVGVLKERDMPVMTSSAKTGEGVEEAFQTLTKMLV